ncbi:MAG: amidase [bacterium]
MLSVSEYRAKDAVGLAELMKKREVSPAEVLEAALALVSSCNPGLNAIVHLMEGDARRAIGDLPAGPLRGVPFLLKDLGTHCRGHPTTNGSRLFANFVAAADSEITRRYRSAGLVILGKTNTPEMGMCCTTEPILHGPTRNPWDHSRSPGGSTGGGAAAVIAGIVPVAHGTDSAGSIRIPASNCGLFGLMPSRGRVSTGPMGDPLAVSRPHVVTRSVRDSAVLLDVSAGPLPGEPFAAQPQSRPYIQEVGAPVSGLRIGYARESPSGERVDPECIEACELAAKLCESLGHRVEAVRPPIPIDPILQAAPLLCFLRSRLEMRARELGRHLAPDDVETTTWAILEYARTVTGTDYVRAADRVHDVAFRLGTFFESHDLLLTPVLADPPLPLGTLDMNRMTFDEYMTKLYVRHMPFTRQFNFSGGPAMSVPMHMTKENLPVGVQFGADVGREDILFRLAAQIEAAKPWHHLRPSWQPAGC